MFNRDSQGYLNTYHPIVLRKYYVSVSVKKRKKYTIDKWIREKGAYLFRDNTQWLHLIRLEIRALWSLNGTGRIFYVPDTSRDCWMKLMNDINATDVVTIERKSISKMSRREISKHGPEFFAILKDTSKPLGIPARYFSGKWRVMKEYYNHLMNNLISLVSSKVTELVSIKSKKRAKTEIREFKKNIRNYTKDVIKKSIVETKVPKKFESGSYHTSKHVMNIMIQSNIGMSSDVEALHHNLVRAMHGTYGRDIEEWFFNKFANEWKTFAKANKNSLEEQKTKMIKSSLNKVIKSRHPLEFDTFLRCCEGDIFVHVPIGSTVNQLNEADGDDSSLFENDDDDVVLPCRYCNKMTCQNTKSGRKKGEVMTMSNPTMFCPKELFKEKMGKDVKFTRYLATEMMKHNKKVKKIGSNLSNANNSFKIEKIVSIKTGVEFDKEKHINPLNQNKLIGSCIGNSPKEDNNKVFIEYKHKGLPEMMFLLEVNRI